MARQSPPPLETGSSCTSVTRVELQKLDALETPEGQLALAYAAIIDSGRSLMAASATGKELRATLDAIRDRAPKVKDSVDEFTARRAARRGA